MARNGVGIQNRNRRRVAAVSVASFLALLGYEAARVQAGGDPALGHAKARSSTSSAAGSKRSQQSTARQPGSTTTQQNGSTSAQQDGYGGSYGAGQSSSGGYYTPPSGSTPSTGSS
jgi:hypothetical protein